MTDSTTAPESIAAAVTAARAWLGEHPDDARYTDTPATATLTEGLRVSVSGPDGASLVTDMPASVGGGASAPSPGWMLRAAAASCVATLVAIRGAWLGVTLADLAVTVDSVSDDRGILDVDPAVPAGPFSTRIVVRATRPDTSTLGDLAQWAVAHCPVSDALRRAVPLTVEVETADPAKGSA
jgi:uncharacterized OsmC-like protein